MRAPMVADGYYFSMHRLLAVLVLAALPLYAAETFEARSPRHSVVLESNGAGEYLIRVTDLETNAVLMRSTMKGEHTATEKAGGLNVSLKAMETGDVLTVSVRIETDDTTVDLISGSWLIAPREAPHAVIKVPPGSPPLRVGGDVKSPVLLHRVEPVYPAQAKADRIEGVVILEAVIDRTGHVRNVYVLKPLPEGLSEAATAAVKQWTFAPGTLNGAPIDVLYNLSIVFHLK
jgi:TonB family protein